VTSGLSDLYGLVVTDFHDAQTPGLRSVPLTVPGLVVVEHELAVPLDHADPAGEQITLFAREVADPDGRDRPFLVFLQGGPGQEAPRPTRLPTSPGWLDRALADYRVLMVDQRGTGRSSPVGTLPGLTPQQQADRLVHFRADAIVSDCELLREALGVTTWSVLGQSFGGFCALRYLTVAPGSLREAFFTGGVPPVGRSIDEVYAATYTTMRERNARYHATYPGDRARLERLLEACDAGEVLLPGGEPVTARRLRHVGQALGMSDGAAHLHYLLERDPGSPAFAHDLAAAMPFQARNPLYLAVHEACYADGGATRWAAERTMPKDFREDPTLLFGEHVFPWTFADDQTLAPLADAAELLAQHPWPRLYDEQVLASVDVPAAAAIYAEDAYVDRALSEETVALVPGLRGWVTNEYEHNGLRVDGARILDRLIAMARGRA
jgi:pimeloyl-ACP methyl ester carboxylesterase